MSQSLEEIYSAEWFKHHAGLRDGYHAVANAILAIGAGELAFEVVDVGCGAAFVIERFAQLGYKVRGYDGSPACLTVAPESLHDRIEIIDFRTCNPKALRRANLAICLEVAEHVPAAYADKLVSILAHISTRTLVFSAAPPGQGGHDHINEQPMPYWLAKFEPHGLIVNERKSIAFRERLKSVTNMPWFAKTTVVLEKV